MNFIKINGTPFHPKIIILLRFFLHRPRKINKKSKSNNFTKLTLLLIIVLWKVMQHNNNY